MTRRHGGRRRTCPEVIQTSAMDCGPAALKCLLDGHGIPASYGRLRDACQTGIDGTSIDVIEDAAVRLGLDAEQAMLPLDYLLAPPGADAPAAFPALLVVERSDGFAHFVVVWRRSGHRILVMDPATGRRWVPLAALRQVVLRHQHRVPAGHWRAWLCSAEGRAMLRGRLRAAGASAARADRWLDAAAAQPGWRALAALDAAQRMVHALVTARGLAAGAAAAALLESLQARAAAAADPHAVIPARYWSVAAAGDRDADSGAHADGGTHPASAAVPDAASDAEASACAADDPRTPDAGTRDPGVADARASAAQACDAAAATGSEALVAEGAVLIRVRGPRAGNATAQAPGDDLAAVLLDPPARPLRDLLAIVHDQRRSAAIALLAATTVVAATVLVEALLLRGLFDIARELTLVHQRVVAIGAVVALMLLLWAFEWPIAHETLRIGRHWEMNLRTALLRALPRLPDRYLRSRPVSDMAERAHGIGAVRALPGVFVGLTHSALGLLLTWLGIALIAPASAALAALIAVVGVAIPVAVQRALQEREMRLRTHNGALQGFYLDALLGIVAIRAHAAARTVQREHEALVGDWARAAQARARLALAAHGAQKLVVGGLAAVLVGRHVSTFGVDGELLLLAYWALRLPALADAFGAAMLQLPGARALATRLHEPLASATADPSAAPVVARAEPVRSAGTAAAAAGADADADAADDTLATPAAATDADTGTDTGTRLRPVASPASGIDIRCRSVAVVAGGHTLLDGVDLSIRAGERVAIVGASGAGKSTLLGLLLGWHRPQSGEVRVDGLPLDPARLEWLRAQTAWIDPAVQLWNRSLLDNIAYAAPEIAGGSLAGLLERADLREVVARLPAGLQTPLGEGGGLLSGGEGQRVRLARALNQRGVRLVLLDEPFRGLDRRQRHQQLAQVRQCWPRATLLCVTHDIASTQAFDRVLVVEHGVIVEDATPAALARVATSRYSALLRAEADLQREVWGSPAWRRLRVEHGQVHAAVRPAHEQRA